MINIFPSVVMTPIMFDVLHYELAGNSCQTLLKREVPSGQEEAGKEAATLSKAAVGNDCNVLFYF